MLFRRKILFLVVEKLGGSTFGDDASLTSESCPSPKIEARVPSWRSEIPVKTADLRVCWVLTVEMRMHFTQHPNIWSTPIFAATMRRLDLSKDISNKVTEWALRWGRGRKNEACAMAHSCRRDAALRRRCVSPRNFLDLLWFTWQRAVLPKIIQGNWAMGAVSARFQHLFRHLAIGADE